MGNMMLESASETTLGSRGETALRGPRKTTVQKSFSYSQEKVEPTPRFLIVERTEGGNFDKISPFLISKTLYGIVGELKNIK